MKPVEFPEQNTVYAKDQPEYLPLPAHRTTNGAVTSCLELTAEEREEVARTGRIYLTCLTFNRPLQPVHMATEFVQHP